MAFSKPLRALVAAACGALCLAAAASPIVYGFAGNVTFDEAGRGYQGFTGSFNFDSAAPDLIGDPSGSTGAYTGPGWALSLAFDGGAVLSFGSSLFLNVTDNLGGMDQWGLLATGGPGTVSAALFDFTMAALSGHGLPLRDGGYTLADFGGSQLQWESGLGTLQGQLTALSCTSGCVGSIDPGGGGGGGGTPPNALPEPGSLTLVLASLCLLPRFRRSRGARAAGRAEA